jgi:hypothetical protein
MQWRVAGVAVGLLAVTGCLPWKTYTSKEGSFKVDMPGKPQLQQDTLKKRFNKKDYATYTLNTAVVTLHDGAFLAAWADVPDISLDLNNQAQQIADQYGRPDQPKSPVTVLPERPELDGVKGVAFTFHATRPAGEGVGRLWQFPGRLYLLLVLGPRVDPESSEVNRFFNSFQLTTKLMQPSRPTE